jgi:hypothetical protein
MTTPIGEVHRVSSLRDPKARDRRFGIVASGSLAVISAALLGACGGGRAAVQTSRSQGAVARVSADGGSDDQSRCDFRGRPDREAVETAGPGAVQPNVRRVYQLVGSGESIHRVIACREIDTNLDGIKDVVRVFNEKGESLREEADGDYDGRPDTWITFSNGRIAKEEIDTNGDGRPDVWKYYVGGQLLRIQRDVNFDGKPDRWEFYDNGKLERAGLDLDFDTHVDRWDHDQVARLAAEQADRGSQGSAPGAASAAADAGAPPADPAAADAGSKRRKR